MKHKTFLTKYTVPVAWLALLIGAGTIFGQQPSKTDLWLAAPTNLSLAMTQVAPADSALTSVEEGQTPLDESFGLPQGRLQRKRPLLDALKDTTFEFNFRTFYFDRSDFNGSEKQAWAI